MKITKRLGVAVYLAQIGVWRTIKYLTWAHKCDFKKVVGNLLDIKNAQASRKKWAMYRRVYKLARDWGFEVTLDVNPYVCQEWELKNGNFAFVKNIGATIKQTRKHWIKGAQKPPRFKVINE